MITRIELQEKSSQAVLSLIQDLQQQLLQKEQALKAKDQTIESLTYRLNVMLQHRFGKKQDQLPNPHQGYLFDEALVPENADEIESADDAITVARFKRKKPGRKPLPGARVRTLWGHHPGPGSRQGSGLSHGQQYTFRQDGKLPSCGTSPAQAIEPDNDQYQGGAICLQHDTSQANRRDAV